MTAGCSEECTGCEHLLVRGESLQRRGSTSERTPFLESRACDSEPVLRYYCTHPASVRAAGDTRAVVRPHFRTEHIEGIDHLVSSDDVAVVAEHPGAVSCTEVAKPARPAWCRLEG